MSPRPDSLSNRVGIGVGVTTLVTILMVLLLTTFSVLTLASARYDRLLSDKAFAAIGSYYQADRSACAWLAEAEAIVAGQEPGQWAGSLSATGAAVQAAGEGGEDGHLADAAALPDGGLTASISFPIDANRRLDVRLHIAADGQITVLDWLSQTEPAAAE